MTIDFTYALPYLLLWVALGFAMFAGPRLAGPIFLALSLAAGVVAGIVDWAGVAVLALFAGSCLAAVRTEFPKALRALSWGVVVILAVALAMHQMPGINNILVLDGVSVSALSAEYTLYWNYDKGFAGVVLYSVCVQPQESTSWKRAIAATGTIAVLAGVVVGVLAMAAGFVAWDLKWPAILGVWVPAIAGVDMLAEETSSAEGPHDTQWDRATRRVSEPALAALLAPRRRVRARTSCAGNSIRWLARARASATPAYHLTGRVEASIVVHFLLNLAHLVLFSYPFVG